MKSTRKGCSQKAQVVNKQLAVLDMRPRLASGSHAGLSPLPMMQQAKLSIEDLPGKLSRQFIDQLLMMAAVSGAEPKHLGRAVGEVHWHGSQAG